MLYCNSKIETGVSLIYSYVTEEMSKMIRTKSVILSTIKAIACRQKLPSGGSGIVIIREDAAQPGIASISKTSGDAILTANTSKKLFPPEAFREAIALTAGLPFQKRGSLKFTDESIPAPMEASQDLEGSVEEEVLVDSAEYQMIVDHYTDRDGKLSYTLLNKDMIKFTHSSSRARKMLEEGKSIEEIRTYVVGTKFRNITGNKDLTDEQVLKMVELLDEVSPKGVFKEFNEELRRSQSNQKQK